MMWLQRSLFLSPLCPYPPPPALICLAVFVTKWWALSYKPWILHLRLQWRQTWDRERGGKCQGKDEKTERELTTGEGQNWEWTSEAQENGFKGRGRVTNEEKAKTHWNQKRINGLKEAVFDTCSSKETSFGYVLVGFLARSKSCRCYWDGSWKRVMEPDESAEAQ